MEDKTISMTAVELEATLKTEREKAIAEDRASARPQTMYAPSAEKVHKDDVEGQLTHFAEVIRAEGQGKFELARKMRADHPDFYRRKANFNETTTGEGIELVPQAWENIVTTAIERYGYARTLAHVVPMSTKSLNLTSGAAATGYVVAEGSAPTLTSAASFFTGTVMTAKKVGAGFIISLESIADANPVYMQYLAEQLGVAVAKVEDVQFINGNGSGSNWTGLLTTTGVNVSYIGGAVGGTKTVTALSYTDLIALRDSVNISPGSDGLFIMPRTSYSTLQKETITARPVWDFNSPRAQRTDFDAGITQLSAKTTGTGWQPLGYNVVVVPDSMFPSGASAGNGVAIFGDTKQFGYLGTREGMTLKTFNEYYNGTGLAGTNQIGVDLGERIGIAFPTPSAFGVLRTTLS